MLMVRAGLAVGTLYLQGHISSMAEMNAVALCAESNMTWNRRKVCT